MEHKHLESAPIKEALIDLQIELPKDVKAETLQALHDKIKADYPKITPRREFEGKIEIKDGKPTATSAEDLGVKGFHFTSANGQRIAQFRLNGFTFNRLKPYKDWNDFRGEAFRLWEIFSGAVDCSIKRVGVRYINVLELPAPITSLETYLKCLPALPVKEDKKWFVSSFMNTVELHDPVLDYRLRITQARQRTKSTSVVTVHLDIDVFKVAPFGKDFKQAWEAIDAFRKIKNDTFFGLITSETEALHNGPTTGAA